MIADVEDGLIDVVVVYKIDRLSRALTDFSKLVEIFDRHGVTFVSVTQSFNTTTSMGRLTLNILLSFAQFEREVIGERIRDKVAASKKKGMWMGGFVPLGYDAIDRKLVINPAEAENVRTIFELFARSETTASAVRELDARGIRSKRGRPKAELRGPQRLPAAMVEEAVIAEVRRLLRTPEIVARTARALRKERPDLDENTVVASLAQFDDIWAALIPAEQARVARLLVARVTVGEDGMDIDLRHDGLGALASLLTPKT